MVRPTDQEMTTTEKTVYFRGNGYVYYLGCGDIKSMYICPNSSNHIH
jgi:hypothetical protein